MRDNRDRRRRHPNHSRTTKEEQEIGVSGHFWLLIIVFLPAVAGKSRGSNWFLVSLGCLLDFS